MLTLLNVELVIAAFMFGGVALYAYPNARSMWRRVKRELHARVRVHG